MLALFISYAGLYRVTLFELYPDIYVFGLQCILHLADDKEFVDTFEIVLLKNIYFNLLFSYIYY